jgi:hypothetical protein
MPSKFNNLVASFALMTAIGANPEFTPEAQAQEKPSVKIEQVETSPEVKSQAQEKTQVSIEQVNIKEQINQLLLDINNPVLSCTTGEKQPQILQNLENLMNSYQPITENFGYLYSFITYVGECPTLEAKVEGKSKIIQTEVSKKLLAKATYSQLSEVAIYLATHHQKEISIQTMGSNLSGGTTNTRAFEAIYYELSSRPEFPNSSKRLVIRYAELIKEARTALENKDVETILEIQSQLTELLKLIAKDFITQFKANKRNTRSLAIINHSIPAYLSIDNPAPDLESLNVMCSDEPTQKAIAYYFTNYSSRTTQQKNKVNQVYQEYIKSCIKSSDIDSIRSILSTVSIQDISINLLQEYMHSSDYILDLNNSGKTVYKLFGFLYLLEALTKRSNESDQIVKKYTKELGKHIYKDPKANKAKLDQNFQVLREYLTDLAK